MPELRPEVNWAVVRWLRSPEGEKWSEARMQQARYLAYDNSYDAAPMGLTWYGSSQDFNWRGIMSIKSDG
jgi:hypothetical protein